MDPLEKRFKITIRLSGLEDRVAKSLYTSLLPETLSQPDRKRGEALVKLDNNTVIIYINSTSVSGARALFNAYVYLLMSALNSIIDTGKNND